MVVHKPSWFSDDHVLVSTAPSCGLTKGGRLLARVDPVTGRRLQVKDPETGEMIDAINDVLHDDMEALRAGEETSTLRFIAAEEVSTRTAVPVYYDQRFTEEFEEALASDPLFEGFTSKTVGEMVADGLLELRGGHGSPSQEQRVGDVPYIKVSDLRAGTVNINPTNRVPRAVAEKQFWKGPSSGLKPFDLISPERTSKNIGDFCVLMPGQENVVVTKEVIIARPGPNATFDPFYLLWAFTLKVVRAQWKRVVFMQTNREDVGKRYLEIRVPVPPTSEVAADVSARFRSYYQTMARARASLTDYLAESDDHHFFMDGSALMGSEADAAGTPAIVAPPSESELRDEL